MKDIKVFKNPIFGEIRTIMFNKEPWFIGKDVAEALGYANTKDAVSQHVSDEDKRIFQRSENATFEIPNRGFTIINESGLYALIFGSKLESAKEFKRWVTSEVLPSIRRTGRYISTREASPNLESLSGLASIMRAVDIPMAAQKHSATARAQQAQLLMDTYGIPRIEGYIKSDPWESEQLKLEAAPPTVNIKHVDRVSLS